MNLFHHAFRSLQFFIICIIILAPAVYAEDPGPVEIGGPCTENGQIYHSTTNIAKTPWQLNDLYALPVGTLSPESWVLSPDFSARFHSALQSGETPQAFAQACSAVWQDYFSDTAAIAVNLKRTITATHDTLECITGNWVLVSTDPLEIHDLSGWLNPDGSPFQVLDPDTPSLLETGLQSLLDNLNAQPGAVSPGE